MAVLTQDQQKELIELYVALAGRAPDTQGFSYWSNIYDGTNREEIAGYMWGTPDAQAIYTDTSSSAIVTQFYTNVLGRQPDANGLSYWTGILNQQKAEYGETMGIVKTMLFMIDAVKNYDGSDPDGLKSKALFNAKVAKSLELLNDPTYQAKSTADQINDSKAAFNQLTADIMGGGVAGEGQTFYLTTGVDNIVGTAGNDTFIGDTTTIGTADVIVDTSVTDNDVFNITLQGDMPAFTVSNVENINITMDTLGNDNIDVGGITGATITVGSERFGFSGTETVANVGANTVVAGNNITDLIVNGVTTGVINAGQADSVSVTTANGTEDVNLVVNGDTALTTATTGKLNVTATADAVLDITAATATTDGSVAGSGNLTLKTTAAGVSGETITNDGTGTLTLEVTNDANLDMSNIEASRVILDAAYSSQLTFANDVEVTATQTGNTATFQGPATVGAGGTNTAQLTLNLQKAANGTDTYTINDVTATTLNAEQGGTIAALTNPDGGVTINTGKDLVLTAVNMAGQALAIAAASQGKVNIQSANVAAIIASDFTYDLSVTEAAAGAGNNISIVGSQAQNAITLTTNTAVASVVTQDADDKVTGATTTGKLTVKTAGGNDTIESTTVTTGQAAIDAGAGNDTVTVKVGDAAGSTAVTAGDGDDTVTVQSGTAGTVTVDAGAGNDSIHVADDVASGQLANTATVTITAGDGDDTVYVDSNTANSTETLSIDGGAGYDIVEVVNGADFSAAALTLTDIDELKIDQAATFSDDQLNGQTFKVSSGTSGVDILTVELNASLATDTPNTTDLSTLAFSTSTATAVEYLKIDATASASGDTIKGGHNVTNVIDLGAGKGAETVQLFADGIGTTINNLQSGATQPDVTVAMLTGIQTTKVEFDVAVISNFNSADDSLILGPAATATNYTEIAYDFDSTVGAPNAGIEDFFSQALNQANTAMSNDSALRYVYVYDTTDNGTTPDAWLFWDSDGNSVVDAAILLVGVETANDGTGFAASDIIAG